MVPLKPLKTDHDAGNNQDFLERLATGVKAINYMRNKSVVLNNAFNSVIYFKVIFVVRDCIQKQEFYDSMLLWHSDLAPFLW